MVYNFKCVSLQFTNDGSSIVSAWNDGVIRAFTPITGRLIYAIPNAHNKGELDVGFIVLSRDGIATIHSSNFNVSHSTLLLYWK